MRPSGRNTGCSSRILSRSVLARGESSLSIVDPSGSSIGVISLAQKPSASAFAYRICDS